MFFPAPVESPKQLKSDQEFLASIEARLKLMTDSKLDRMWITRTELRRLRQIAGLRPISAKNESRLKNRRLRSRAVRSHIVHATRRLEECAARMVADRLVPFVPLVSDFM